MNDYDLDIMRLAHEGYCCSQIVMLMTLELQGISNPGLIRAMNGLCHGEIGTSGPCGAYGGAACVIAYYSGKGNSMDIVDERLPLMLAELADWFGEYAEGKFGGTNCSNIVTGDSPDRAVCGSLVAECYGRAMSILTQNGIDPTTLHEGD